MRALPVHLFEGPAVRLVPQGQGAARAHRVDDVAPPKLEEVTREERALADDRPRGQSGEQQEHARPGRGRGRGRGRGKVGIRVGIRGRVRVGIRVGVGVGGRGRGRVRPDQP